jgi:predicted nucleotide-binding protein (sugar kinase/HSP70/actin superfamily)
MPTQSTEQSPTLETKTWGDKLHSKIDTDELESIEAELKALDDQINNTETKATLKSQDHWTDNNHRPFTSAEREHTTILVSGLTYAHDVMIQAALQGIGYNMECLEVPDNAALQVGKEYGNRGQCNPTYFTVGNLVKSLEQIRDEKGMTPDEIIDKYIFLTAGACGPCRFGTYVTEYRKALRDAGFGGFRVVLFQQQGGMDQVNGDDGLVMNFEFFRGLALALLVGDALNAMMYRIRPYEVHAGETDRVIDECRDLLKGAFSQPKGLFLNMTKALFKVRRKLAAIEVDKTIAKPKVSIIGEFWAMTTEGDGNYKLQSFLEGEGAEVDIQLVTAWILFMIWEQRHDTKERMKLGAEDNARKGLDGKDTRKKLMKLWGAEKALRGLFFGISRTIGLGGYVLPDMNEIAETAHEFYHNDLRGGEGHMEVAKLILNTVKKKVNMTVSVKPFGCMPSSGVSDGVQSLITERYPEAIFCPIETTGDGAVNVYSRVQMMLFKAKQSAVAEQEMALTRIGMSLDQVKNKIKSSARLRSSLHKEPHFDAASTGANLILEVGDTLGAKLKRISALKQLPWNKKASATL